MPAAKKPEAQIMDVSKPGKVPAEPSARPVIVGHKPMVQDPMVTSPEADNPDEKQPKEDAQPISPSSGKKVIVPLGEQAENAPPSGEQDAADTPEDTGSQQPAADEAKAEEQSETPESTDVISESAVVDSVVDQVDIGTKREEEQKAEEERKKAEALEKLIVEKKYFVPIGKTHRTSKKGIWVFTAVLLLIFIGLIGAIDAEVLEAGFSLPFDFL